MDIFLVQCYRTHNFLFICTLHRNIGTVKYSVIATYLHLRVCARSGVTVDKIGHMLIQYFELRVTHILKY
jgi:hypothetical protein